MVYVTCMHVRRAVRRPGAQTMHHPRLQKHNVSTAPTIREDRSELPLDRSLLRPPMPPPPLLPRSFQEMSLSTSPNFFLLPPLSLSPSSSPPRAGTTRSLCVTIGLGLSGRRRRGERGKGPPLKDRLPSTLGCGASYRALPTTAAATGILGGLQTSPDGKDERAWPLPLAKGESKASAAASCDGKRGIQDSSSGAVSSAAATAEAPGEDVSPVVSGGAGGMYQEPPAKASSKAGTSPDSRGVGL